MKFQTGVMNLSKLSPLIRKLLNLVKIQPKKAKVIANTVKAIAKKLKKKRSKNLRFKMVKVMIK